MMSHHVTCHVTAMSHASSLSKGKRKEKKNKINIKSEKEKKRKEKEKLLVFKHLMTAQIICPDFEISQLH